LKQDEGVDIAVETVSEITELAWTIVHEHMIEEQCFAFACDQATEEMLQIVEWDYLSRDDGEVNTVPSWNEDVGMGTCETQAFIMCTVQTLIIHTFFCYRAGSCSDRHMGTRYHTTHH